MISQRLQTLFLLSIPVFVAHGLEEYFTAFYDVDIFFEALYRPFQAMSVAQATFLLTQLFVWALLIIGFLAQSYYPGVVTAFALPIIGVFFWKEFIKNLRATKAG
ncbi:MAG: hypothetical protein Q8R13_05545 [bacterium]|nr:hypothetical protein [bacterium]MDZ4296459.1 hypothetical protein [Patescibacteria group bacterium]